MAASMTTQEFMNLGAPKDGAAKSDAGNAAAAASQAATFSTEEFMNLGAPPPEKRGLAGAFTGAVSRGLQQTWGLAYEGLPALVYSMVGDEEAAAEKLQQLQARFAKAQRDNPTLVADYTGIDSPTALATYVAEAIGENLPSMVPGLGVAGIGAGLGRAAIKKGATEAAEAFAKRQATGTAVGLGTGAVAGSAAQNIPETFADVAQETGQQRPGVAMAFGGLKAGLDAIPSVMALKRAFGPAITDKIAGNILKRMGVGAAEQFAAEGATEGAQEALDIAASKFVDDNREFFTKENVIRIADAGLKGGLGGAALGAATGAIQRPGEVAPEPTPEPAPEPMLALPRPGQGAMTPDEITRARAAMGVDWEPSQPNVSKERFPLTEPVKAQATAENLQKYAMPDEAAPAAQAPDKYAVYPAIRDEEGAPVRPGATVPVSDLPEQRDAEQAFRVAQKSPAYQAARHYTELTDRIGEDPGQLVERTLQIPATQFQAMPIPARDQIIQVALKARDAQQPGKPMQVQDTSGQGPTSAAPAPMEAAQAAPFRGAAENRRAPVQPTSAEIEAIERGQPSRREWSSPAYDPSRGYSQQGVGGSERPFPAGQDSSGLDFTRDQQGNPVDPRAGIFEQRAREQAAAAQAAQQEEVRRKQEAYNNAREARRRQYADAEQYYSGSTDKKYHATPRDLDKDGNYPVDQWGFVVSTGGGPMRFMDGGGKSANQKAALWIMQHGQRRSKYQVFDRANHPSGKGIGIVVTGRNEPPGGTGPGKYGVPATTNPSRARPSPAGRAEGAAPVAPTAQASGAAPVSPDAPQAAPVSPQEPPAPRPTSVQKGPDGGPKYGTAYDISRNTYYVEERTGTEERGKHVAGPNYYLPDAAERSWTKEQADKEAARMNNAPDKKTRAPRAKKTAAPQAAPAQPQTFPDESSGSYKDLRNKYAQNTGMSSEPRIVMDWLVKQGSETGHEHIVVVDRNGNVTSAGTANEREAVAIPKSAKSVLDVPGSGLILHHNHPVETGLSRTDMRAVGATGLRWVIAYTPSGNMDAAGPSAKLSAFMRGRSPEQRVKVRNGISKAIDAVTESVAERAVSVSRAAGVPIPDDAYKQSQVVQVVVGRVLERAGLINHVSSIPIDPKLLEGFASHEKEMAREIIRQFNAHVGFDGNSVLFDRPTPTLSIEEGLARISGVDAALGSERAGSEGSDRRGESDLGSLFSNGPEQSAADLTALHSEDTRLNSETAPSMTRAAMKQQASSVLDLIKTVRDWADRLGNPLATLPDWESFYEKRGLTKGAIQDIQDGVAKMREIIGLPKEQREAAMRFMATQGASPSMIKDEKQRALFVKAKQQIIDNGQKLVDLGLLPEDVYRQNKGKYLPRMYLKFLLDEDADRRAAGSGAKPSDMGHLKHKKDIPEDIRKILYGEIDDPGFLAARSISVVASDIAKLQLLQDISENSNWVAEPRKQLIEWRGKKYTPQGLKAQADSLRTRIDEMPQDRRDAAMKMADDMDRVALTKLKAQPVFSKDYKQIPDTRRWGALRGLWVRKEIYDDMQGTFAIPNPDPSWPEQLLGMGGWGTKITQAWKTGKVVLNPPSVIRNLLSGVVQANVLGRVPIRYLPVRYLEAAKDIAAGGKYWQIYHKYGGKGSAYAQNEMARINRDYLALQKAQGTGRVRAMARFKDLVAHIADKASDAYQLVETIGKVSVIIDAMERGKLSERDAMIRAEEAQFDYSNVPPWMRYLRNSPVGVPFITYAGKVLPALLKTAVTRPVAFTPYIALAIGLPMLFRHMNDIDMEEWEKLKKVLPEWARQSGVYILPIRDSAGRWHYLDMNYIMPWGMLTQAWNKTVDGKPGDALKGVGLFGAPLFGIATAITTGIDPFTNRPIVQKGDPPWRQYQDTMLYAMGMAMPPWLAFGDVNAGWAKKLWQAANNEAIDRRGNPTSTLTQALGRTVGINLYGLDPEADRQKAIRQKKFEIDEIKRRRGTVAKDQRLKPDEKKEYLDDLNTLIREKSLELAEYTRSTNVAPKLRVPAQ